MIDGFDLHESITVDNAVWAFDDISFALFFTVLVVGEFVVFHVEAELVWGAWLRN